MPDLRGRLCRRWSFHVLREHDEIVTNSKNPFVVDARAGGENVCAARNIRNSISLTMRPTRRIICAPQ
ncbi:hypothetical protein [Bradyrhizobium sp. CCGUVB23]|uniref:hypothetical protein n=1 Tax=Bradyrhizobium sp. CCGUVB23 TaxID=2949630 RepID=UPI0020B2221A|nr:hypothetical protein [Bradyrhizobium sp. CCGUVB23]MCP3464578.1 hypothetical protein [Bradyrhizobium sp. CCGUVB23]